MTTNTKKIWIGLGLATGALVIYLAWLAYSKGTEAVKAALQKAQDVLLAPVRALTGAASTVADNAAAAASLPALANQSALLDQQLATLNTNDYAPGGRIYLKIAAAQGTLAADASWEAVQKNLASQQADTAAWWQLWK